MNEMVAEVRKCGPEVIRAVQQGDYDAFAQLFEAYRNRVYSVALRFSGDPAAALDIAQETFLKLFDRAAEFRGEASFESWLYRIVVNACLDHQRRARRWRPLLGEIAELCRTPLAPRPDSALDAMLRAESSACVHKAVAELPPMQRMAVVLRYTEELSYEQIAQILECSLGTVASRLNRAHQTLGRKLKSLAPPASAAWRKL